MHVHYDYRTKHTKLICNSVSEETYYQEEFFKLVARNETAMLGVYPTVGGYILEAFPGITSVVRIYNGMSLISDIIRVHRSAPLTFSINVVSAHTSVIGVLNAWLVWLERVGITTTWPSQGRLVRSTNDACVLVRGKETAEIKLGHWNSQTTMNPDQTVFDVVASPEQLSYTDALGLLL